MLIIERMSTLLKNKILTGLVILLLIANVATIVVFWTGMKKMHPARPFQQPSEFIIKELSFNASQQQQYVDLVKAHREQTRIIQDQVRAYKDSFFDLLSHENINDSIKNNFAEKTAALNHQLDLITFDHFKAVRKIGNPEQQIKFDLIIKDVLRMMGGPARGKRPPGQRGDRPSPQDNPL